MSKNPTQSHSVPSLTKAALRVETGITRLTTRTSKFVANLKRRPNDLFLAGAATAFLIAAVILIGKGATSQIPQFPWPGYHYLGEIRNSFNFLSNYDAPDYIDIAIGGYTNNFWVNWFPLYPLTIHALHVVVKSALDSSLLLAWSYLAGATYFYVKVARRVLGITGDTEPLKALALWVLLPTGVFLVAPFAESMLALLSLAAILLALRKRYIEAGFLALLASATHITGAFVAILVGLILFEERAGLRKAITASLIGLLGITSYMAYLWDVQGHPLAFLESQQDFHGWTHQSLLGIVTHASLSNAINVALLLAAAWFWRRRRPSFALYSLMFLTIPLLGHQYGGFDRYVLMAFPIPLMGYELTRNRPQVFAYLMALLGMCWAYVVVLYTGGYIGS